MSRRTRAGAALKARLPLAFVLPVAAAALAAALLGPAPAHAQAVRLIPSAGLYVPQSDLGRFGSGSDAVEIAKGESTLAVGLGLEFLPHRGVSFRLNGLYGAQSAVPISGVGCANCEARSSVSVLAAAAVLRPIPDLILFRPYLQLGAGIKRYDFDDDVAREEGWDAFLSDQNKVTAHLGVGLEVNLGLARLLFELSDFVSGFDLGTDDNRVSGPRQHDFFLTVGLAIGG